MSVADRLGSGTSLRRRTRLPDPGLVAPAPEQPPAQVKVVLGGLLASLVLAGLVLTTKGGTALTLFVLGLAFGLVLFHSRFGFTSAWRQLVAVGQGKALRAHMLMLAAACTLFAPVLAGGVTLAGPAVPSVMPIGTSLFIGAFLFGVGMQLGGSCASGTLFAIGSGQSSILITLVGFVGGSVLGAYTFGFWTQDLPTGKPVSLADTRFGYLGAWVVSLAVMGAIVAATYVVARRRRPPALEQPPAARGVARAVRGSWPLWVGGLLLAGLNLLTLLVSGGPWGITFAFSLWGSKILDALGVDVTSWPFWADPANAAKYQAGLLGEKTSVMDLGIVLGALVASAAAGAFVVHRRIPAQARPRRRHRRRADGARRPDRLRLQHRRLLRRHRVVQPARLGVGRDGPGRDVRRAAAAAAVRAHQPQADRLGLLEARTARDPSRSSPNG